MPVKCQTVINLIDQFAPKRLAEDWDNIGLNVGDNTIEITGVFVTLDVNQDTVNEALSMGANFIVAHHPLIFKPVKNIRADQPMGRLLTKIIKNDISVFCVHTNLDSAQDGVNQTLAEIFDLQNVEVLNPDKPEKIFKIVVFVPESHFEVVREAVTKAGAGWIGGYSDCTFSVAGTGTFKPTVGCKPFIGQPGFVENVAEVRLETVVKENQLERVVRAMVKAHPYEEVAYDVYPLANDAGKLGLGRIGFLKKPVKFHYFMDMTKELLKVSTLRYGGDPNSEVQKIAVCGGSGASFMKKAAFFGADVLLTGDIKYHEAQNAIEMDMKFVDAGHYPTENPIVGKLAGFLNQSLVSLGHSLPVYVSTLNKDTFKYY